MKKEIIDLPIFYWVFLEQLDNSKNLNEDQIQKLQPKIISFQKLLEQKQLLPREIKKGALRQVLGYSEDFNLQEASEDELFRRQKKQITDEIIDYQTMIRRLNWQQVMNKTNNPDFSEKLRRVMKRLKDWWESE